MIETNQAPTGVEAAQTPSTITTTMILTDLENGIDRPGIRTKYNLEAWELTEMFKHPVLKGKKASRKRKMSFNFVDDTPKISTVEVVAENQVDLEESIDEVEAYNDEQTMAMEQELDDRKQAEADYVEGENDFSNGFDA